MKKIFQGDLGPATAFSDSTTYRSIINTFFLKRNFKCSSSRPTCAGKTQMDQ